MRYQEIYNFLQGRIRENVPLTAADFLNLLTQELGFPRLKLVLAEVEPNGYKKSMIFLGIATVSALLFDTIPDNILNQIRWLWLPKGIWLTFIVLGIFYFIDDSRFYYILYRMERNINNKNTKHN